MVTNASLDSPLTAPVRLLGALQDSATATQGWEARPRVWPGLGCHALLAKPRADGQRSGCRKEVAGVERGK